MPASDGWSTMSAFKDTSEIQFYHAHIYYDETTLEEARTLRQVAGEMFDIPLGRLHERPVGPHTVWSCQLTVPKERFGEIVSWLALNRGKLDFFIHPVTGDDVADHTQHVMWLGRSYPLDLNGL